MLPDCKIGDQKGERRKFLECRMKVRSLGA
jgi:hypothetical protein